jgi:hypothetical protein
MGVNEGMPPSVIQEADQLITFVILGPYSKGIACGQLIPLKGRVLTNRNK